MKPVFYFPFWSAFLVRRPVLNVQEPLRWVIATGLNACRAGFPLPFCRFDYFAFQPSETLAGFVNAYGRDANKIPKKC